MKYPPIYQSITFIFIVLLTSCSSTKTLYQTIGENKWELNYISGTRIAFDGLYPDRKPEINFDLVDNKLYGNTSCNAFNSAYEMKGNQISISSQGIMTMVACPGNGEQQFLDMLYKVDTFNVEDDELTFYIDDVAVMRFKKKV
ncbi:META domain-containing protein [Robertkochia solimangrovi]|uniref:META domain-containing protein n=1 Tax=Robertkochia solimangrovi TaxID=2213046 RepID=UPI00117E51D3|nr:META domain-containing protein [Robertkochia solimangrovi]TRZ41948.1 META domain-containing protein [Robertkochia solimangrovi]